MQGEPQVIGSAEVERPVPRCTMLKQTTSNRANKTKVGTTKRQSAIGAYGLRETCARDLQKDMCKRRSGVSDSIWETEEWSGRTPGKQKLRKQNTTRCVTNARGLRLQEALGEWRCQYEDVPAEAFD